MMAFQPAAYINQQGKACGMRLGKAVLAKALNLCEDAFGKVTAVAAAKHAIDQFFLKRAKASTVSPGGHGSPKLIGLACCKTRSKNGQLHHLLLKNGYAQGALQGLFDRWAWVVHGLKALTTSQVGVDHAPLNGAWPHNGHFNDQVVKALGFKPRQHTHLGA